MFWLSEERTLCAKLSDMGIGKRLFGDICPRWAFTRLVVEVLVGKQQNSFFTDDKHGRLVCLALVVCSFFCITGDGHPFGDCLERDINIVKNQMDLVLVEYIPEAEDLLSHLFEP